MKPLCFDTTALLLFAKAGILDEIGVLVGKAYVPEFVLEDEIQAHVARYPENQAIVDAPWLEVVDSHPDDAQLVATLLKRWASRPGRDQGEAEVIASALRYGYTGVFEDQVGRNAARQLGIPTAYTVSMFVASAAARSIKPKEAWQLHSRTEAERKSFHVLTGSDSHQELFIRAFQAAHRLGRQRDLHSTLDLLGTGKIDDIVLELIRRGSR